MDLHTVFLVSTLAKDRPLNIGFLSNGVEGLVMLSGFDWGTSCGVPSNVRFWVATELTQAAPQSSLLNDDAFLNM